MLPSGLVAGADPQRPDPALSPRAPLRVLLVAPQPFFAQRGTPINVRQMAQVLCEAGHVVHLATYPMGAPVSIPGLHLHRALPIPGVREVPIGFSWRKLLLDVSLSLRVWGLLAARSYDVVHAVEESVFFAMPAARLRGIPVIYDMDSSLSDQLEYEGRVRNAVLLRALRRMERAALGRARLAITVCTALSDAVRSLSPHTPVAQIEDCPIDESLREPDESRVDVLRTTYGLSSRRIVMYTGNLEGYQGIDLLLDAFVHVARAHRDAALVLVGGTPSQIERVRDRARELSLSDRVVLPGARPAEEMPEWMALGDVLVSPRRHGSNTPLKLYSYMWSGVPIVATDLPTHTQVLDASIALLRAPTPESFASGILDALESPERCAALGAAARARVASRYSRDVFRDKLLAAYASVVPAVRSSVATSM